MKLIYISQGNIPSKWAHTFQAMKMADALASQVDALTVVTACGLLPPQGEAPDFREWYGINNNMKVVRLPVFWRLQEPLFTGWKYPRFDRVASWFARLTSPDVVYTRSANAGRCCVNLGLKTIIEFHMGGERSELFHITSVKEHSRLLGLVTISQRLKEHYVEAGLPAHKILVWPDAVDMGAFDALPEKEVLRQRLGLAPDAFIATYCGHFYEGRGIEEILSCAYELPAVRFMMIGGWEDDITRRKAEAVNLDNVQFQGFLPNRRVPEYLKASDVLLMPYTSSCDTAAWMSPLKLFEYMASGCPIVATDLPAIRIHLTHGRNALLVAPGDGGGLAASIRTLMARGEYARSLARAARRDVAPYTWDNRARAVLSRFCTGMPEGERVVI